MLRHREGQLKTNFATSLGKISYQVPCHLRVQNVGLEDARGAAARARHGRAGDRALLGPRRHVRREEGIRGRVAQDRAPRRAPGRQRRGASTSRAIARWRPSRSRRSPSRAPSRRTRFSCCAGRTAYEPRDAQPMDKLTPDDLLPLEAITRSAPRLRAEVLAHKRHRQAPLGPNVTLYFEDRLTMQLSGPGDAARGAHLRVRGDRRGARGLQPADSRRQRTSKPR